MSVSPAFSRYVYFLREIGYTLRMFLEGKGGGLRTAIERILYVFIAVFPFLFYIGYLFHGTSSRAINLVVVVEVVAILLGFMLLSKTSRLSLMKSPITLSLLVFLVILVISGFFGVDVHTSFWSRMTRMSGIFYFIHIGVFYLFLTMLFTALDKRLTFIKTFLVSAAVFSVGALLSNDGLGLIFVGKPWDGFTFGNSSFAAMYVYAAFTLSLYYVYAEIPARRWWHWLLPLLFVINPFFINKNVWLGKVNVFQDPLTVVGGAQASAMTAVVTVLGLLVVYGISRMKSVKLRRQFVFGLAALGIIVLAVAIRSFTVPGGFLNEAYLSQETPARPIVWELSRKAMDERPVWGWGTDNFDRGFEKFYDNRLLEKKNGAEPWFDRAHNILIDQRVESGMLGLIAYILVYIAIAACMLYVILQSSDKKRQALAAVLLVYFVGHFVELQTAFDTTISYPAVAIMAALAAAVFHDVLKERRGDGASIRLSAGVRYAAAVLLIGGFGYLFVIGTVPIIRAQNANGIIHRVGSSAGRLEHYPALFSSPVDPATILWKSISDFQRGIAGKPEVLEDPAKVALFVEETEFFAKRAEEYLVARPDDYRMHLTLANLYIYQRLLGVDSLGKAHDMLDRAALLVPQAPQTYWMKSVAYLYQAKFLDARRTARQAYDLNPGIEQSRVMIDYIERSMDEFPNLSFYNFWQI